MVSFDDECARGGCKKAVEEGYFRIDMGKSENPMGKKLQLQSPSEINERLWKGAHFTNKYQLNSHFTTVLVPLRLRQQAEIKRLRGKEWR